MYIYKLTNRATLQASRHDAPNRSCSFAPNGTQFTCFTTSTKVQILTQKLFSFCFLRLKARGANRPHFLGLLPFRHASLNILVAPAVASMR